MKTSSRKIPYQIYNIPNGNNRSYLVISKSYDIYCEEVLNLIRSVQEFPVTLYQLFEVSDFCEDKLYIPLYNPSFTSYSNYIYKITTTNSIFRFGEHTSPLVYPDTSINFQVLWNRDEDRYFLILPKTHEVFSDEVINLIKNVEKRITKTDEAYCTYYQLLNTVDTDTHHMIPLYTPVMKTALSKHTIKTICLTSLFMLQFQ